MYEKENGWNLDEKVLNRRLVCLESNGDLNKPQSFQALVSSLKREIFKFSDP